ncbi:histidine phosphatase family protein [Roseovarius pacificus]|uniref:SixA phosphatase family protein n=1 Tax=Roseovarius pacificus TaxID=337701 RepID=UPI002A18944A|nr:histidine phosphatase family protein [Roseovarius pacificus]
MTLRLILMRHAKSSWDDPALSDHARPLNGRGRRSASALGDWLRAQGVLPDQILSSSSERTRETCARLGLDATAQFTGTLYHAGPATMLRVLHGASGQTVLMLGHNPGIADFAHALVATPPPHPGFETYPTCATLVADFAITDWADLAPGTGQTVDFIVPRDLTG